MDEATEYTDGCIMDRVGGANSKHIVFLHFTKLLYPASTQR